MTGRQSCRLPTSASIRVRLRAIAAAQAVARIGVCELDDLTVCMGQDGVFGGSAVQDSQVGNVMQGEAWRWRGDSPATANLSTPSSLASDGTSIWVTNGVPAGCLVQYVYGSATTTSPSTGLGSLSTPTSVAIDATGSIWTTNSGNNTVSKFIGLSVPVATPVAVAVGP